MATCTACGQENPRQGTLLRFMRSLEELEAFGETGYTSTVRGLLAEALYQQGRYDEAYESARVDAEHARKKLEALLR